MGDNWISQMFVNAVSAPVANAVASAGGMAGGAVGSVGNGINSIGAAIEQSIRNYGNGVKDYGNAIQDWTKASGPRQGTASNPLGLAGNSVSGKMAFTGGSKSKPTEVKKITAPPKTQQAKKAPSSTNKASTPAKTTTKPKAPAPGATKGGTPMRGVGTTQKKVAIKPEARPSKPKVPAGASKSSYGSNTTAAQNPLGLS